MGVFVRFFKLEPFDYLALWKNNFGGIKARVYSTYCTFTSNKFQCHPSNRILIIKPVMFSMLKTMNGMPHFIIQAIVPHAYCEV